MSYSGCFETLCRAAGSVKRHFQRAAAAGLDILAFRAPAGEILPVKNAKHGMQELQSRRTQAGVLKQAGASQDAGARLEAYFSSGVKFIATPLMQ
jgi:hypothetical protein